ncbi:MAG: AAA family ATPase [Succinivibrio sp.]|nr:AAA family ATPase [Succinivibrio sp.]MCI7253596.1 ATP-binding protein [Succinatimonas sp.]
MSNKQFLPLPTSVDNFAELITTSCYYVDKTPYLKEVFADITTADDKSKVKGSNVLLFTRPRRFGKTLLMNMFESFLQISGKNPGNISKHLNYFKGTKILEDQEFCDKYMGQCPVIAITLKDVSGDDFKDAYFKLAEVVAGVAAKFEFLMGSPKLNAKEKAKFDKISDEDYLKSFAKKPKSYLTSAIASLASMLYKHFNKQVYVLIDEYDVPLAKAQSYGYHKDMVTLMSSFLGFLKDSQKDPETNKPVVKKVILTGCLKVAKNSIFTGVNNLKVNTVTSKIDKYTGMIGFTKEETLKLLKDYEMEDFSEVVKNNYDGYKFYDKEMFCPWDVLNFVEDNFNFKQQGLLSEIESENYWANSTSSSAVYEYLGFLTDSDNQKMQDLVDGNSISFVLNESMNYDCLSEHDTNDFWSLLLHTGYLTLDWEMTKKDELSKDNSSNKEVYVRIPNLEIKKCFKNDIQKRFDVVVKKDSLALNIANALLEGNVDFVQNKLGPLLRSFVSIRDTATKAPHENYYHGFLNGIFTNCKDNLGEYHSNFESGDGYADILFKDIDCRKVAIIEIKSASIGSDIETLSEKAISQIIDKNYAEPLMSNKTVKHIYGYGIAFAGKSCFISVRKIK